MATLLLTAVGTAVGGPVGGAIGALIGQQADVRLFAPKARHGPRLGDLAIQTSSYGTQIPKLFGTMRVAGTIIWASDLRERRSTSGGGKGQPRIVQYSYSASFAVALSARPIRGVKRIWAEGKLLRGAAGDFKSRTGFRLHHGGEDQAPDPLIVSVEGIGNGPAHRGIAYAMFEDMELADFGNRIPSLTFEVEADAGPVTIAAIARELSGGVIAAGDSPALIGYAASGSSIRGATEELAQLASLSLMAEGDGLRIGRADGPVRVVDGRGAAPGEGGGEPAQVERRAAVGVPDAVTIAYHDPARDYQTSLQRAAERGHGRRVEERALAGVIGAAGAKMLAEDRLAHLQAGRSRAKVRLPSRMVDVRPGAIVAIEGTSGRWRVEGWTLERMVVELDLVRVPGAGPVASEASAGRPVREADLPHGPTNITIIDAPIAGEPGANVPTVYVAAAGGTAGWRRAALSMSLDDGASWQELGATAAEAVMGTTLDVLAPAGAALFDARSSVEVRLLHDGMWLEGRSDAALVGGANAALIGDEIVQFGSAEPLGGGRFRLSRLLRGRRGTEWAAETHAAGERFVLLSALDLAPVALSAGAIGGTVRFMAQGIADDEPAQASVLMTGDSVRPPSPVHLRAERQPDGAVAIRWVRRSRSGWAWTDGGDVPIGEEAEGYRLTISGAGWRRTADTASPSYTYGADEQSVDGASGSARIEVVQLGTVAPSRPAFITISM